MSLEERMARMEGSAEHFATKADIKDLEVRLTRLIYAVGVGLRIRDNRQHCDKS